MHPFEHSIEYLASLQDLETKLNRAIAGAYPAASTFYAKVGVLFFRWANDDIGVEPAEDRLAWVLQNIYGYEVSRVVIPSDHNSKRMVIGALLDMINEYDKPNSLSIVIYSGHARGNANQCLWSGTIDSAVTVDWLLVRRIVGYQDHDMLEILDCCYAAVAAIDSPTEVLVSSSQESVAGFEPEHNFTMALADILENSGGRAMTVAQIHAKLVRNADKYRLEATPVHAQLGNELSGSICLARLGDAGAGNFEVPDSMEIQIVVTAYLQGHSLPPDFKEWNRFLRSAVPRNLRHMDIKIEAHSLVNTGLALLQFSVPLPVFSVLKAIGPFRYLCVAHSSNLFLRPTVSSAIHPPREEEYCPRPPIELENRPSRPATPAGGRPAVLADVLRRQGTPRDRPQTPQNEDASC
ncbi:hypothetical protein FN846DRAFT_887857 [Sphaerosporella brunnea]|uniref:Caspase domain-containing protein n=1 Tax=Sphaerosporella brunnea TaxID=1250544 RepID=A0A5J5F4K9_9PEZI|nr:hypothetical protein FN846DRAFT_887857 [Sphaerosporella brunnea]